MSVDFRDAAERHWEDANHLLENTRLANADHLFGLSAECALKAVMLSLGMMLQADDAPANRQHRVHINQLWDGFITFVNDRNGTYYAVRMTGILNPFDNWDINQRYQHRSNITHIVAEKHQQGATLTKQILETAVLNGDII